MNTNSVLAEERDQERFDSVTDEEIIYLWRLCLSIRRWPNDSLFVPLDIPTEGGTESYRTD